MRKTRNYATAVAASVAMLMPTAAWAVTAEELDERLSDVERAVTDEAIDDRISASIAELMGHISVGGMIDTTYLYQDNVDPVTGNGTPLSGGELSTFNLNQVELRFSASSEWAAMLAEVEFFADPVNFGVVSSDTLTDSGGDTLTVSDTDEISLEQGWVAITPPGVEGFALKLGKFNAPIGLEALDPDDRMQVTTSFIFNDVAPFNLTGAMLEYFPNENFGIEAFIANGWDVDSDFDRDKSYGGRVSAGFGPVGLAFTYIGGKEDGTNDRQVFDGVVTFEQELGDDVLLFLGGEVSYGMEDNTSVVKAGSDTEWLGFIAKARIEVGVFGLTLRYDYLDDEDGFATGTSAELHGFTVSPSVQVTDNMLARLEYTYNRSGGADVFSESGTDTGFAAVDAEDDNNSFWVQLVYSF